MLNIKSRLIFLLTFIYIVGLILFAFFLQYFQSLEPCPLCMLQRIVFIAIALITLLPIIHNPDKLGIRIYCILNSIFCLLGLGLAGRHVWLESLPAGEAPACGPSFDIMMEYLPITEVIKKSIIGSGDCARIDWSFLNLSIADWSLLCFGFLLLIHIYLIIKPEK